MPDGALYAIGELLGIPASDVEGVATLAICSIINIPLRKRRVTMVDVGVLIMAVAVIGRTTEQKMLRF